MTANREASRGALDVVPDVQRLAVGQVVEVQWAGAIF